MKKYTDEQLSRILSVAAVRELGENYRCGNFPEQDTVCIEQAAYADLEDDLDTKPFVRARGDLWDAVVNNFTAPVTPAGVLSWLEWRGMA